MRPRAALVVGCVLAAFVVPRRAASAPALPTASNDPVLEISIRVGWIFGRGLVVGPAISGLRASVPGDYFQQKQVALLGGVVLGGDFVVERAGGFAFRLRVGPEVGAVNSCPGLGGIFTGGVNWVIRPGVPARLGFDAGASLVGVVDGDSAPDTTPFLLGVGYRFARSGAEIDHELDLDARQWLPRFSLPPYQWSGLCGALGKNPERLIGGGPHPV